MAHSRLTITVACFGLTTSLAIAGDWPQILGPTRNGAAVDEQIRRDWAGATPTSVWQHDVGQGFAGVAVAAGRVLLFHRLGNEEVVESLDANTGEPQWTKRWPAHYRGGVNPDMGPRCVPLVHEDAVYLHGAAGQLFCLNLTDGQEHWSRDTQDDFGFVDGYFGVGSSPLVIDDKLLVNVGGRNGGGIVAFSLDSGETMWQSTDEGASYSSPVATTINGRAHALFVTRLSFLSIDPANGHVRFQIPFGQRGATVNGANPVLVDETLVLLTASYGVGGRLIDVSGADAEVMWSSGDVVSSQYPTPVVYRGAVYAMDGREDIGVPSLRCFDPLRGEIYWSEDNFGMATLIVANNTLLAMKTDGELVLVEATPEAYRELARCQLLESTARALPALSEGRLYVRDMQTLKCFDLR